MIEQTTFGTQFLERLDPVFPGGLAYVQDVVKTQMTAYCRAYRDEIGPVWAWGVVPMWKGVGSVWMIFDRRAPKHAFRIVREARIYLEELDTTFKRLQGEIHEDAPTFRLASLFRFEQEGVLRNYGMDGVGDYVMTARIN